MFVHIQLLVANKYLIIINVQTINTYITRIDLNSPTSIGRF